MQRGLCSHHEPSSLQKGFHYCRAVLQSQQLPFQSCSASALHLPANPHGAVPSVQRLQLRKEISGIGSVGVEGVHSRVRVWGLETVTSWGMKLSHLHSWGPAPPLNWQLMLEGHLMCCISAYLKWHIKEEAALTMELVYLLGRSRVFLSLSLIPMIYTDLTFAFTPVNQVLTRISLNAAINQFLQQTSFYCLLK